MACVLLLSNWVCTSFSFPFTFCKKLSRAFVAKATAYPAPFALVVRFSKLSPILSVQDLVLSAAWTNLNERCQKAGGPFLFSGCLGVKSSSRSRDWISAPRGFSRVNVFLLRGWWTYLWPLQFLHLGCVHQKHLETPDSLLHTYLLFLTTGRPLILAATRLSTCVRALRRCHRGRVQQKSLYIHTIRFQKEWQWTWNEIVAILKTAGYWYQPRFGTSLQICILSQTALVLVYGVMRRRRWWHTALAHSPNPICWTLEGKDQVWPAVFPKW